MSLNDNRTVIIDTNHTSTGGMSCFSIAVPLEVISKAPKSVKLLDCYTELLDTDAANTDMPNFISAEQDAANNHVRIENPVTRTYIDVYLPTCLRTGIPLALPATNLSGYGVTPITDNAELATTIQAVINAFTTPNLGLTFTVAWQPLWAAGTNTFEITCTGLYIMRFDVPDSFANLIGFGRVKYEPQNALTNYPLTSPIYVNYYNNHKKCYQDGISGRKYFEKNYDRKIATKKYIRVIKETLEFLF